jgi:transposase
VIGILDEVTGINVRIGAIVVAEIGTVVDRFPSEAHICSWAGLCPAAKISAGKRLEPHNGQGESVVAPSTHRGGKRRCTRASEPCLRAYYQRLRKRMGHKKAIVALAHRILVIIYHLLKDQQPYRELGPDQDQEKAAEAAKRWALRRLEQLGYQVTLEPTEVA